jgi:hypothetical protein
VLRTRGAVVKKTGLFTEAHGIHANRWARDVQDIAACLHPADVNKVMNLGYVQMLNSWGQGYPHLVHIPLNTLHRLIFSEDGDATVVTDR